ncbi:hypothetical protein BDV18DRAFT_149751 [Aspergillus unguis]
MDSSTQLGPRTETRSWVRDNSIAESCRGHIELRLSGSGQLSAMCLNHKKSQAARSYRGICGGIHVRYIFKQLLPGQRKPAW